MLYTCCRIRAAGDNNTACYYDMQSQVMALILSKRFRTMQDWGARGGGLGPIGGNLAQRGVGLMSMAVIMM